MLPTTTADLRRVNLSRVLRAVHTADVAPTRAELGRWLGCVRGTMGALVTDLDGMGLVTEDAAAATGRRGRPSGQLVPSRDGPVVVAVEIATDSVRVATVALGGELGQVVAEPLPDRQVAAVVAVARGMLDRRLAAVAGRCAGVGVVVHGLVDRATGTVSSAPGLGWAGVPVDLRRALGLPAGRRAHVDNVAQCSALAEATRGRARGRGPVLFLHAAVGLGGALVVGDRPVPGRRGFAGEYGHLPFGPRSRVCRCGGRGCWESEVDQLALARAAGLAAAPGSAAPAAAAVFADAARGVPRARRAVRQAATALGRGIGALINAHDPELVVLAGHAADLLAAAPQAVHVAVAAACLPAHRGDLPPVEASALAADGGLLGAAESVFDYLLDDLTALTTPWPAGARPVPAAGRR